MHSFREYEAFLINQANLGNVSPASFIFKSRDKGAVLSKCSKNFWKLFLLLVWDQKDRNVLMSLNE